MRSIYKEGVLAASFHIGHGIAGEKKGRKYVYC